MTQTKRLSIVLGLNLSMIAGLIIFGLASHSLGLLAAGGDYIADSMAVALGLLAIYIRDRSGGKSKATTYVAGINGAFLLIVTLIVAVEAVRRLAGHNPIVNGLPVLIVSSIAAVVMIIGALILQKADDETDLHMRSVLLDTIADAVSAGAVAIAGGIILLANGAYWLDSVVALVVGLAIAVQAVKLLRAVVQDWPKH